MGKLIDIESVYAILEDAGEALEMLVETEIVKCRECKHWTSEGTVEARFSKKRCGMHGIEVRGTDFCSWGEKR